MMRPHRPANTSFYEELGLERNASAAEIRDSFRCLVRLLHPDQQLDPDLKAIAERQLRRINGIYAVLSDTDKRRQYDLECEEDFASPTPVFGSSSFIDPKRLVAQFIWVGATIILAVACLWLYMENPASVGVTASDLGRMYNKLPGTSRAPAEDESPQLQALRSDVASARSERDAAKQELNRVKALLDAANHAAKRTYDTSARYGAQPAGPEFAAAPDTRVAPAVPRSSGAAPMVTAPRTVAAKSLMPEHQFAGFWFYSPGTERPNKNLYAPQFIEAILTEHNGVVHGRYRSRYRIVDRAISPDVNFEFSGTPAGLTLTTPWTGLGGAKGQVSLRLISENSLKLDWTASELGNLQGLGSGTATLTRRID